MFSSPAAHFLKEFNWCFYVKDPMVPIPPCNTHPNWKVDDFLGHLQEVSWSVVLRALSINIDCQTAGFKVHYQNKIHITYNSGGGIFQINIICDCGFTCTFYFCNPDSPKNVPIFDYHHCTLDFILRLISFMTTSMRVTFIIFKWAQNQHLHI